MRRPQWPVLGQRYRLMRQIDSGGMGSVWLAEAVHLRSLVAVKVMDRALAATPEAAQRFLHEARTAASLRSPHVVQILDYGVHESTPFIVMELLEGESLATRLKREGRLASWEQTELVLRHVARALGRAHDAGVVHRDLKPGNVFLVRDEEEEIVKLLDFGIAKSTLSPLGAPLASDTRTGEFLGSPAYSSPEQLQASKAIDHRADIWSLGIIAYECLLGQKPFASDNFVALLLAICTGPMPVPSEQGRVPAGFDAWFARVCARDVAQRFQHVREASAELKRLVDAARGTPEALAAAAEHAAAVHAPALQAAAVHAPALPAAAERAPSAPPSDGVALSALSDGAPRAPAPPSLTVPMLLVAAPNVPDWPVLEPPSRRTDTVPLAAAQVGKAPRRRTKVLTVMLALPAVVALATFTLGASSSRAALDWSRLALSTRPPSAPQRHDGARQQASKVSRPTAPERGADAPPLASSPRGEPPRGLEPVPGSQASSSDVPSGDAPSGDAPSSDAPGSDAPSSDAPGRDLPSSEAPTDAPNSDESPSGVVAAVAEPGVASKLDGDPGVKEAPEPSTSPALYSPGLETVARERGAPAPLPEATPSPRPSPRVPNDPSTSSPSSTTSTPGTVRSSSARLTVTASEPSMVWLDGKPFGTTPLESIRVTPGTHEVTFVRNGERSTETLTIRRGEHKRVEARIESPPGDGLNEAAVKRTIATHRSSVVDTCMGYAVGTLAPGDPTSVRVPVTIRVEPSGEVRSVVTQAEPPGYLDLRRCVEERVATWRFPGARAETVVNVAFVFVQR